MTNNDHLWNDLPSEERKRLMPHMIETQVKRRKQGPYNEYMLPADVKQEILEKAGDVKHKSQVKVEHLLSVKDKMFNLFMGV